MKTAPVREFLGSQCRCGADATEPVLSLWEEYVAWSKSRAERPCAPKDFFEHLAAEGIQVAGGYARGVCLSPEAKKHLRDWQYTPLPPGEDGGPSPEG